MIQMFHPFVAKKEIMEGLDKVFSSKWVGEGEVVKEFEKAFGAYIGNPYCVATNSCTAALDLAYELLGLHEATVATPVLTCTATNHPLLKRKCQLDFIDIDPSTLNPDAYEVEQYDASALVVVHLNGNPVDVDALSQDMDIVEDCAQALGAKYPNGKMVGNSGNLCAFSFQAIKHITTGDGGMLVCRNEREYNQAKRLRWFGIDREAKIKAGWHPTKGGGLTFNVDEVGFKYHMNNIAASIGLAQMPYLESLVSYRRKLANIYKEELKDIPQILHGEGSSYWTWGIFTPDREVLIKKLADNGIESNVVQVRNDVYDVFKQFKGECPNMDKVGDEYLYLPLHQNLTEDDIRKVCDVVKA